MKQLVMRTTEKSILGLNVLQAHDTMMDLKQCVLCLGSKNIMTPQDTTAIISLYDDE
jgi:hypothetical protein